MHKRIDYSIVGGVSGLFAKEASGEALRVGNDVWKAMIVKSLTALPRRRRKTNLGIAPYNIPKTPHDKVLPETVGNLPF